VGALRVPGGPWVVEAGGTLPLRAVDAAGGAPTVTWSVASPHGGAVSPDGTYRAPSRAGVFTVVATSVADPSVRATAEVSVPVGVAPSGVRVALSRQRVVVDEGVPAELLLQVTDPGGAWRPDAALAVRGLREGLTARVERVPEGAAGLSAGTVSAAAFPSPAAEDPCQVAQPARVPRSYLYRVWLESKWKPPATDTGPDPIEFVMETEGDGLPADLLVHSCDNVPGGCGPRLPKPSGTGLRSGGISTQGYSSEPRTYVERVMLAGDQAGVGTALNDLDQVALHAHVGDSQSVSLWRGSVRSVLQLDKVRGPASSLRVEGLNDTGLAVGYLEGEDGVRHARLWRVTDATPDDVAGATVEKVDLGTLPGGTWSHAYAVNDAGRVVGVAGSAAHPSGVPFLAQGGRMVPLDPFFELLEPEVRAVARDVNAAGDVLVVATRGNACATSYLWQNGVLRTLTVPGSTATFAAALNASGQVVGDAIVEEYWRGFTWKDGTASLLDVPEQESHALAVNADGLVLGSMGHAQYSEYLVARGADAWAITGQGVWAFRPTHLNDRGTLLSGPSVFFPSAP
jgi:uncharacterized membrane protein